MDHIDWVRTPEELFADLAKAFQFSPKSIRDFREGRLPAGMAGPLLPRIIRPALKSAGCFLGPLFIAAFYTSMTRNTSFFDAIAVVAGSVLRPWEFAEDHGWFRTILCITAALASFGTGLYFASKVPISLITDIMASRVRVMEGRVNTREEERKVPGRRDEQSFYYFDMKTTTFEVSKEAFRAIDSGGSYKAYYLPASRILVALEPSGLEAREQQESFNAQSLPAGNV